MKRMSYYALIGALVSLAFLTLLVTACSKKQTAGPEVTVSTAAPDRSAAQQATPTAEFRVELPSTPTLAAGGGQGAAVATDTPGPTPTPTATKTPWPTRAPTSAPVEDANMVYVPGGEFTLGRDGGREDESPQQTIYVDGFNIDVYPVTNAEYRAFVEATGHRAPRHWKDGQIPPGKEDHPVVWVSWEDAAAYAAWAGKRLPSEIEWEKAARGTDGRLYPWGDVFDSARCNSREAELEDTSPVGAYPEGASPYGALDMCGNVWEWTADWYDAYRGSVYHLERYGATYKVLRGGSWFDGAGDVMVVSRNSAKPTFMFSTIGFRCVK